MTNSIDQNQVGKERGIEFNDAGMKSLQKGSLDQAIALFEHSIEACQSIDDWEGEITALNNLAAARFRKWAQQRSLALNWDNEMKGGLLGEGLKCLAMDIKICIAHGDLGGAGQTVNDVLEKLIYLAGLSQEDATLGNSIFIRKHVVPQMRENNIRELPGPLGFLPAVTLTR